MLISRETFTSQQRILARKDYQKITRFSVDSSVEKKHSTYFLAFIKPSDNEMRTFSRLGITVSKRVSKRAVDRNQIKRHVREVFRRHPLRGKKVDIVVIAKPSALKNLDDLQADIKKIFNAVARNVTN